MYIHSFDDNIMQNAIFTIIVYINSTINYAILYIEKC